MLLGRVTDRSLIKDNVETVEFENQEFLDYLAAKELARFDKVEQVFFDVAIEPHILELYTSWFYILPFVFELKPSMIGLFLDFLQKNNKKVFSSDYFQALLNMEPENLSHELKSEIFDMVFDYYTSHTKWFDAFSSHVSRKLSRYYDDSKYHKIINSIDGRKNKGTSLTVVRTNAIRLIALLTEDKKMDERKIIYWQDKASEWLKYDVKEYRHLHQNILQEFANISNGDFEWIKKHKFIFEKGIQVQAEYARACFNVAPNDIFSIDVYLETDKYWRENKEDEHLSRSNDEYDYILKLNNIESMKYALDKIWKKELYNHRFCENLDRGIFKERKVEAFRENLLIIVNDDFVIFLKNLIENSMGDGDYHSMSCNGIYQVFIETILQKDKNYIEEYISICVNNYETKKWHYYHSFLNYISIDFVSRFFDDFNNIISDIRDEKIRSNIIGQIYYKLSEESEFRKKIINKYPELIKTNTDKIPDYEKEQKDKACKNWIEKIEPEPKKFSTDLFRFYLNMKSILETCENHQINLEKTIEIAKEVLKNNNPLITGKVEKKNGGSATIWQVHYYESCIEFVHKLSIELDQNTRDNVFRYLPFNMNMDYETTLAVAKDPSKKAIQDIVDVYAGKRDDDLGVYHVRQFIELYNSMKFSQFEPVLLEMLKNKNIADYERVYIAQSLSTSVLTVDIIKKNKKMLDEDCDFWKEYLTILISKHKDSIDEAFEWTKQKAVNMVNHERFSDPMAETENNISIVMSYADYPIKKDKEMLLLSSKLSEKGQDSASNFLKKVVESHLKYVLENKPNAHEVILDVEKFLDSHKNKKDLHWFEYTLQDLKKVYLDRVHESNIVRSIKKYNQLEKEDYLPIVSSFELRELVKSIIEEEIRRWIEDEGAYKHILELAKKDTNTNAEDFIQKSIKSQMEVALLKRGFRDTDYRIIREEQLLDDKRLDFTVSYGFIGSVMIELKLAHNTEAKPTTNAGKQYVKKLEKYMHGSNSDYGLFVIFNVKGNQSEFNQQIVDVSKLYESNKNISVVGLDCYI